MSHVLNVLNPGTEKGNAYAGAHVFLMRKQVLLMRISCVVVPLRSPWSTTHAQVKSLALATAFGFQRLPVVKQVALYEKTSFDGQRATLLNTTSLPRHFATD